MIRLLVVEDVRLNRSVLTTWLNLVDGFTVVGAVGRGEEVPSAVLELGPDVVLLDIGLPGVGGLAVAAELRKSFPQTKVLMLTGMDGSGYVRRAYDMGVHGYVPKTAHEDELVQAIHGVHDGKRVYSAELLMRMSDTGQNPLTAMERRVLRLRRDGLSVDDIADRLLHAKGTVRNHVTRAIAKVNGRNMIDAIRIATEHGWLDADD